VNGNTKDLFGGKRRGEKGENLSDSGKGAYVQSSRDRWRPPGIDGGFTEPKAHGA